jgi:hypothetical protein
MPPSKTLISVIMPNFNAAPHLRQAENVWLVKKKFAATSPQLIARADRQDASG